MPQAEKRTYLAGAQRAKLKAKVKEEYDRGASIRELAKKHDRSYGLIHTLLREANTDVRPRGGNTRRK